jgi:hypothetical protein
MNKFYLLLLTVLIFSCKSQDQKTADEFYEKFKTEITNDSLSVFAKSNAEYVADFHYDPVKKEEAKNWLSKMDNHMKSLDKELENKKMADKQFLARNLKLSKTLHKDEHCNFLQQHILVDTYTNNKDSLTEAVKILTDSIWSSIPFDNDCIKNIRCGVYLYKKSKDFELNGGRLWFVMGTRITGESVKVSFLDF